MSHGAPRVLEGDRGTSFVSKLVAEILRKCAINHRKTTAYHPQTTGMVEIFNRTLVYMLSMYVSSEH